MDCSGADADTAQPDVGLHLECKRHWAAQAVPLLSPALYDAKCGQAWHALSDSVCCILNLSEGAYVFE